MKKNIKNYRATLSILGSLALQECQRVIDVFNHNDSDSTNGLSLDVAWHGRMLIHVIGIYR